MLLLEPGLDWNEGKGNVGTQSEARPTENLLNIVDKYAQTELLKDGYNS